MENWQGIQAKQQREIVFSGAQNPVTVCGLVLVTGGDLPVASTQSNLSVDIVIHGLMALGVLSAWAEPESRANITSIPEPVRTQLEARRPGVQIRVPLEAPEM